MGIRESMEKKRPLAIIAATVLLVGSVIAIIVQARSFGGQKMGGAGYFTIDDGKTFFIDDTLNNPPFEKDGKQAVRAHVFECGGKRVVGYMSRYTPEALATVAEVKAAQAEGKKITDASKLMSLATGGTELKRPGPGKWVRASDMRAANAIRIFKCPDGKVPPPEVFPDSE